MNPNPRSLTSRLIVPCSGIFYSTDPNALSAQFAFWCFGAITQMMCACLRTARLTTVGQEYLIARSRRAWQRWVYANSELRGSESERRAGDPVDLRRAHLGLL